METLVLRDKPTILKYLRRNTEFQIYCIGDLDDFFWQDTKWYGLTDNNNILSIALLYSGMKTPTLLTFHDDYPEYAYKLLELIRPDLPERFFAHLSPGLIGVFGNKKIIENFGLHYKMALKNPLSVQDDPNVRRLSVMDLPAILDFYLEAYHGNWFDKRMLETGKYFGYFLNDKLTGISGIHVYSKEYKVAALGNIATHPDHRGKQIGFRLTSILCDDLLKDVDFIGLNVKSDNEFAIKCYRKAGFEKIGNYEEYLINNN